MKEDLKKFVLDYAFEYSIEATDRKVMEAIDAFFGGDKKKIDWVNSYFIAQMVDEKGTEIPSDPRDTGVL